MKNGGKNKSVAFIFLFSIYIYIYIYIYYIYTHTFKHSLMLQKEKPCIKSRGVKTFEQNEDEYIFLVLP